MRRKETEALKQQLAEVTQEREQCVRDMSGWMDNGETLSQAICAMRLSASTFKQQLEEKDRMFDGHVYVTNEEWASVHRQLAAVTQKHEEGLP